MSIGNLRNNANLKYDSQIYCSDLTSINLNSENVAISNALFDTIDVSTLKIHPDPIVNNSATKLLVLDAGNVVLRNSSSIFPGLITPTVTNDLASFDNNVGTIKDSGISSSNLCLLDNNQTITGTKTFKNTVTIGNPTIVPFTSGAISLFLTGGTSTTITAGPSSTTPLIVNTPNSSSIRFPDLSGLTDTLVCRNNTETLTNKTIANLFCTGTANLASGKIQTNYTSSSIIGAGVVTLISVSIPVNTSVSISCSVSGFCTAGPDVGKTVIYDSAYGGKNLAGVATAYVVTNNSVRDGAFGGAVITITTSGNAVLIQGSGIASDTLLWAGNITVNYQ
jgi:hypothetical protein